LRKIDGGDLISVNRYSQVPAKNLKKHSLTKIARYIALSVFFSLSDVAFLSFCTYTYDQNDRKNIPLRENDVSSYFGWKIFFLNLAEIWEYLSMKIRSLPSVSDALSIDVFVLGEHEIKNFYLVGMV
jgi:hypothetical protein